MMRRLLIGNTVLLLCVSLSGRTALYAQGIVSSKHNMSVSGPGPVKATVEQPVCAFCHIPHREGQVQPLWQASRRVTYTTYDSSTIKAKIGQPTGVSRLCLACHDGTIAPGMLQGKSRALYLSGGMLTMPAGRTNLGVDLSDDHPISFVYDNALAARNGQLSYPASLLASPVKLDQSGQLQCTSCHDSHDDRYGKFLVMDNRYSALCTTCHQIDYWSLTSHRSANATWNQMSPDPWPATPYNTVAENGCENCHRPHSAGGRERLMHFDAEEDNCFACHSGHVAERNIEKDFNKPSRHPVEKSRGIHDPDEDPLWSARHVECTDCHNPHAANATPAKAPLASGMLAQVAGVSSSGTPVKPINFEYELCYRCHADNPGSEPPVVTRYIFEKNLRLKFSSSNASYHPVEAVGKNRDVPSLIIPYSPSSRISCTDCHASDSGARTDDFNGPHGSMWEPILERQLMTSDFTAESARAYALCYKCHNRSSILSDNSFTLHRKLVVEERAPCTACHDSHGVEQNTHLINFDKTIVFPNDRGELRYQDLGRFRGACYLKCHSVNHDPKAYP